jgi:hypothetical protein
MFFALDEFDSALIDGIPHSVDNSFCSQKGRWSGKFEGWELQRADSDLIVQLIRYSGYEPRNKAPILSGDCMNWPLDF